MNLYQQKSSLRNLLEELIGNKKVILLDYPVHSNIGDILIFLGELKWIKNNDISVEGYYSVENFSFPNLDSDTIILCHGGGNFGNLYPKHQKFREKVIETYPNNRVIILPQTINFNTKSSALSSASSLNKHSDLHILLRDKTSLDICNEYSIKSNTYLMPDMAIFLHNEIHKKNVSDQKTINSIFLLRNDIEKNDYSHLKITNQDYRCDWKEIISYHYYVIRFFQLIHKFCKSKFLANLFFKIWETYCNLLLAKTSNIFLKAKTIVSSRLHGHIFAVLLDIETALIDNNYGKNSAYYSAWHKDLSNTRILNEKNS